MKRRSGADNEVSEELASAKHHARSTVKRESKSFNKAVPGNPPHVNERKRLDSDVLALKHNLNICKEENNRLKEQIHRAQKDVEFKNLYIKELLASKQAHSSPVHDSSGLKQYIRGLNAELEKVRKENERMLQSAKITKLNETRTELCTSIEEAKRLRKMLNEILVSQMGNSAEARQKIEARKLDLENKELMKTAQRQERELSKLKEVMHRQTSKKKIKAAKKQKPEQTQSHKREKELKAIKADLNKCCFGCVTYR